MENKIKNLIRTTLVEFVNKQYSLEDKFKERVKKDTGVDIVSIKFIKRGKNSRNTSFSFIATTDSGSEVYSLYTMTELLKRKESIEIIPYYTKSSYEFI